MRFSLLLVWLLSLLCLSAADNIPPKPARYINDFGNVLSTATENELNAALEQLERTNSTQIIVVTYPKLEAGSLEDFTVRTAEAWGVGQKQTDNGAVLFIFVADRKLRIEVGYGLEGSLPDATAKRIIDEEITPHFRNGDYDAGVRAGVTAMVQAVFGEYRGTGRTVAESRRRKGPPLIAWFPLIIFLIFIILAVRGSKRRGRTYRGVRRSTATPWLGGWGGGGGGWSGGGGGFGGGFSGGGGSFGGGGASGSW